MSYKLAFGIDNLVGRWVANELGVNGWLGDFTAIGVIKDETTPVAGVVYYAHRWPVIEMACASIDPKWLSRKFLRIFFDYPFNALNCKRIVSLVDVDNAHALEFNRKLGFVREAVLKDAHPNGDAVLLRMLKSECRWINGQQRRKNNNQSHNTNGRGNGWSPVTGEFRGYLCKHASESIQ